MEYSVSSYSGGQLYRDINEYIRRTVRNYSGTVLDASDTEYVLGYHRVGLVLLHFYIENVGRGHPRLIMYAFRFNGLWRFREFIRKVRDEKGSDIFRYETVRMDHGIRSFVWESVEKIPKRKIDTIFGAPIVYDIMKEAKDFFTEDTKKLYESCGMPYRKTMFLLGNPGTGKTSTATAIAFELNCNLYVFSKQAILAGTSFSTWAKVNPKSIILIDEIDKIYVEQKAKMDKKIVTLDLLTILDSPSSPTNCVFMCTANTIEHFDEAILREGRLGKPYIFGNIPYDAVYKIVKLIYKDLNMEKEDFKVLDTTLTGATATERTARMKLAKKPFSIDALKDKIE